MNKQAFIQTRDASYELPTGRRLLDGVNLAISTGDKIALVGKNGSGKTTLLKIIAGLLSPTTGSIVKDSRVSYLSQLGLDEYDKELTVKEYVTKYSEEWWDILLELEKTFGIKDLDPAKKISLLSGGEIIKLNLTIATTKEPETLLLDEPTNHLDILSREILKDYLLSFSGSFLITSHDSFFIDQVCTQIWELKDGKITQFGGNYSFYQEQKLIAHEAKERHSQAVKKEIKKVEASKQREEVRATRSLRIGRELKGDRSMSNFEKGFFENKAGQTAASRDKNIRQRQQELTEKSELLKSSVTKKANLRLKTSDAQNRRLFMVSGAKLKIGTFTQLESVDIEIRRGDRVALIGSNGSGKTSLIRALTGGDDTYSLTGGEIRRAEGLTFTYLNQMYEIVSPEKTLLENIYASNAQISYESARESLASFLFFEDSVVNQTASNLSGGERARLAFAMISVSLTDLIFLDEPTNNLDIETVDTIIRGLSGYGGALVVVSHNIDFLAAIGISRSYIIVSGVSASFTRRIPPTITSRKLKMMMHTPEEKLDFYTEMVEAEKE
ncbi:MAG: ABC-F family ATP-binding cassette domain-containing protein [bacterium]|nr:ABC-F family ATP-binding cassette domain-containing protein [bacterium]